MRVPLRPLAFICALGAAFVGGAAQAQSLIRDTEIEEAIRASAEPVLKGSGLQPDAVKFYLVGDKDLNAFVSGGQNIFLNTGLIAETENPNQLLGVIAHEAGHISGGHVVRTEDIQRAGMKPFLLTMGLGIVAAFAGAPDAGAALIGSSGYFGQLSALAYNRTQEGAADQAGAKALENAGLSGKGLVDFFENFRYQEVFSDQRRFQYFRSHPLSSERIEALKKAVESAPHYTKTDSPDALATHAIIKAKLEAFMNPPQQTFVKYGEGDTSFPARYARAIAYFQAKEFDKSLKHIDALLAERPDNPYLWELKGQVLFESGRPAEAEPAHRRSVELHPNGPLLRINLAQSLISQENPAKLDEAVTQLNRALAQENDNAFAWRLLAQAYDSKNMPGQARLASAEAEYALGDNAGAKVFAMRARDLLTKNSPEWRRATDIVLVSDPTRDDLREIARGDGTP